MIVNTTTTHGIPTHTLRYLTPVQVYLHYVPPSLCSGITLRYVSLEATVNLNRWILRSIAQHVLNPIITHYATVTCKILHYTIASFIISRSSLSLGSSLYRITLRDLRYTTTLPDISSLSIHCPIGQYLNIASYLRYYAILPIATCTLRYTIYDGYTSFHYALLLIVQWAVDTPLVPLPCTLLTIKMVQLKL